MAAKSGSAGARSEMISFVREVQTRRAGGGFDIATAPLGDAWAAVMWVRGAESERQGALRETQVYRFTVLSEALTGLGVTIADLIIWNGARYNIREQPRRLATQPETEIIAEYLDQAPSGDGVTLPQAPPGAFW